MSKNIAARVDGTPTRTQTQVSALPFDHFLKETIMTDERKQAVEEYESLNSMSRDQLLHFRFGPIWDGNLNSKAARDKLFACDFLDRADGFQFLTGKGVRLLYDIGKLNESTWKGDRPFKKVSP